MKKKLTLVLLVFHLCAHPQTVLPYNVIISEIMADPSPAVGLPSTEFIELRNTSSRAINLNGWQIADAGNTAVITIHFILQPDSMVIICANTAMSALAAFGAVAGVSNFPSLDNEGDLLYLRSKEGNIIHAVNYSAAWYKNAVKSQGGWSLEIIDPANACGGAANWAASINPQGGTPGRKNSVDGSNTDLQPPVLLQAFAADSVHVLLTFDEPLDSLQAAGVIHYSINYNIGTPVSATTVGPLFNTVSLVTAVPLATNTVYAITATGITDCSGNSIGADHTVKLGRTAVAGAGAIVINEILFNPVPGGADYVEIYNRSNTIIDLKECYLAGRSANGVIGPVKQISPVNRVIFPGEYRVITEDPAAVQQQYLAKDPSALTTIAVMPSLPDDKGNLLLLNTQGKIIDELSYDAHWHFKLIVNAQGVSLERIDYNQPTQNPSNWHSAATSAGYGTPGYQNSQFRNDTSFTGSIRLAPPVFSPDNDGWDDFCTINYQFPGPGYVCNITAFDAAGRPVRYITRNALCAQQGYFRWDGLSENNTRLPIGVYVIYTEVFNLAGTTKRFKQAVTLARRLD